MIEDAVGRRTTAPDSVPARLAADRRRFAEQADPGERLLTAGAFLERVEPLISSFGITRAGRLTGLDRIGVPVWMATRPNAVNLSVSQGKSAADDAAKLGAILEAIELAVAEGPIPGAFLATPGDLSRAGANLADQSRHLKIGRSIDAQEPRRWVEGFDLVGDKAVLVPEEMALLRDEAGGVFQQTSDGLGAGSCLLEALNQGLCELVERDAMGLWSFRSAASVLTREIEPDRLRDQALSDLKDRTASAGLRLRLFDLSTDIGIPTFLATIAPAGAPARGWRHFDLASGTGAHPVAARAALRAGIEAAQTRMTTIAGARDDIAPHEYDRPLAPSLKVYVETRPAAPVPEMRLPADAAAGSGAAMLDGLIGRLRAAGIGSAIAVPLTSCGSEITIARMFVPDLEQDSRARNRRLGRRGVAALMGRR